MKIISLVPSLTELLFNLDLGDQVIGRTKFCIYPINSISHVPKIGGTKKVNIEKIRNLNPDLIIANKEENTKEDILALQKTNEVLITEISDFENALEAILTIGLTTNSSIKATALVSEIRNSFDQLHTLDHRLSVCYLIWQEPYMTIGNDTFIHDMLDKCGFENIFNTKTRYPQTSLKEIANLNPNYIFLSSEPFPFKQKHIDHFQKSLPKSKVILVDGEFFSWYGSRMKLASSYFNQLISKVKANSSL